MRNVLDFQLPICITAYWPEIKDFFNSTFFTAIAGSFAGALGGAWAAQSIAEKAKYKEQLLKEICYTNASIMVATGICSSLLQLKKQYIKSLKENLEAQKTAFLEYQKKFALGQVRKDEEFHIIYDFQTLLSPLLPLDILQRQVFEELSLVGRPLRLTTTLYQTVQELSMSLEKRNQLIELYKGTNTISPALYFGFPQVGQVNQDYPSAVDAIYSQTDDGIFFSQLLSKDLVEHGNQLLMKLGRLSKKDLPVISTFDFTEAEITGYMPSSDNYTDWFTKFVKVSS